MPIVLTGIDDSLISGQVIERTNCRSNNKTMAIFRSTLLMDITGAFYLFDL